MNTKNLKPFNLEAALKGESVMLRNGRKAYVRHHETELLVDCSTKMLGYTVRDDGGALSSSWGVDGRYFGDHFAHLDIIGMYPKTRIINGFEVPAPERVAPKNLTECFHANVSNGFFHISYVWQGDGSDLRALERGLVFLNAEDAIANAKAMLGIDPYKEGEE